MSRNDKRIVGTVAAVRAALDAAFLSLDAADLPGDRDAAVYQIHGLIRDLGDAVREQQVPNRGRKDKRAMVDAYEGYAVKKCRYRVPRDGGLRPTWAICPRGISPDDSRAQRCYRSRAAAREALRDRREAYARAWALGGAR